MAARDFYHDKIGLEILNENDEAIVFKCGGGTHLDVTKSTVGTADEQTQVSWEVPDIKAEVAGLRARGVQVEDYDMPGLKTDDGVADIGFAWAAWIIDPRKNALGIMQIKPNERSRCQQRLMRPSGRALSCVTNPPDGNLYELASRLPNTD